MNAVVVERFFYPGKSAIKLLIKQSPGYLLNVKDLHTNKRNVLIRSTGLLCSYIVTSSNGVRMSTNPPKFL